MAVSDKILDLNPVMQQLLMSSKVCPLTMKLHLVTA